jgi:cyclopropane-fatty-acyl-phospholipid synthase
METADEPRTHKTKTGTVSALERAAVQKVLAMLGDPPIQIILWNGEIIGSRHGTPAARLRIKRRGLLPRLLYSPDVYFGEAYSQGEVEVEGDLVKLLEYVDPLDQRGARYRLLEGLRLKLPQFESRTRARARNNIYHHYDIGNDFYQLWLDQDLVYTCAYFPKATASLEEAQQAKMEYVCRKLRLQPGETVVEAGCGWGALALYMARHYGVRVRAYNLSHEQIAYARERASREGLDRLVEFIEDDYCAIDGCYDAFVSVGMLRNLHELKKDFIFLG